MKLKTSSLALMLAFAGFATSTLAGEPRGLIPSTTPVEENASMELLRASLRMDKREVLKAALALSDKDYEKFWPIYYDYQAQLIQIYDKKMDLIQNYADHYNYDAITDKEVDKLVKASFAATKAQTALLEKYYGQVAKALSKKVAARFVQVENTLNGAFDVKVRSKLPLMPKEPATAPR